MDPAAQPADCLRQNSSCSPESHALPPWQAEDVQSLRPGQPLSRGIVALFFSRVLRDLLHRELAGDLGVLSRCLVLYTELPEHVPAFTQIVGAQSADYLLFPLVGGHGRPGTQPSSLVLACAGGRVLLHLDSQRGAVVGPSDCAYCLRGHLPRGYGVEHADCPPPGEALVADLRAALCTLGGRYAGAQHWPLKAVKVPLQHHAGDSALFMCMNALYLLAGLPGQLTPAAADVAARFRETEIDLFEGAEGCYPGFLTRQWYSPLAAEALRKELAATLRRELEQLGGPAQPLLADLAAVERELEGLSRRPFQLPSERLERQQLKKQRRLLAARRPHSARWASLAAPLAVDPPAAEEAVREALQRLQQLLGPPPALRQPLGHNRAGAAFGEPGAARPLVGAGAPRPAEAAVPAAAAAAAHEQQGTGAPGDLGQVRAGSKRAASGEAGGLEMPLPAAKVPRHAAAEVLATAAAVAHAGGSVAALSPEASPGASPASVTGGAPAWGTGPAASSTSSWGRSYSRWRQQERGALVKALSASDLLKLRFKGSAAEALAKHLADSDQSVQVVLAPDTAGSSAQQRSWVVGVWRAGKEGDAKQINLQRDWPTLVGDLQLAAGDVITLQPDGRQPLAAGSALPRLLLRVHRAGSEAAAAAAMPPPHAPGPGLAQPAAAAVPSPPAHRPRPASPAASAAMQPPPTSQGASAPAAAARQPAGGDSLRQAVLVRAALAAAQASNAQAGRRVVGSSPRQAAAGSPPSHAAANYSPCQGSSHTHLLDEVGTPLGSHPATSSPSGRVVPVVRSSPASPAVAAAEAPAAAAPAAAAATPAAKGAAGSSAPAAGALPGEGEQQTLEDQQVREEAGMPQAQLPSPLGKEGKSEAYRLRKALQVRELLARPPPQDAEPFKRAVSENTRQRGRLLCSGEQLFYTGLLLGEALRLSFWVGGRQLSLPSGETIMECRMQPATGQYQFEEAWVNLLLGELEQASGMTPPYTLVLQRREMKDGVTHVDASLEAHQQSQHWWRRLLQRLQLPRPTQRQESLADS